MDNRKRVVCWRVERDFGMGVDLNTNALARVSQMNPKGI